MHRINTKTAHRDEEQGITLFTDGNPHTPEEKPATHLNAAWCNAVQEELCSFIQNQNINLQEGNNKQLEEAVRGLVFGALDRHVKAINKIIEAVKELGDTNNLPDHL